MSFKIMNKALTCGASACLLAALAVPGSAAAGTLQVDPIKVEITQDRRTAGVTVTNEEKAPVTIRAYALEWSQAGGEDVYEKSSAVIVSPPIFTIPAGGTQTLRIGLRSPGASGRAYRLMIEEVPEASPGGGIRVAIRLNLPLFTHLQAGSLSDLSWTAYNGRDGRLVAEAANKGTGYVRVAPEQLGAALGVRAPAGTSFGVVLPGSSRRWVMGAQPDILDRARFQALLRTNQGVQAQLASRQD